MAFNLSKNNDPVPEKKSNVWVVLILVVAIVGGAVWYFIPKKKTTVVEAEVPAPITPVINTVVETAPVSTPPRIVASFNKGTAEPITISDEIVNEIKPGQKIIIYGYASSEGDLSLNLKLATERAASVKQYLISKGVDEKTITVVGKGIDNPIATNDTETGRAQNRRVELFIK